MTIQINPRAMTAARHLPFAEAKRVPVIAYNPRFTPGTGLQRRAPLVIRLLTRTLRPIVVPLFRISKPAQAGQMLADLALGRIAPTPGGLYASLVKRLLTWPETSDLAKRDDVMSELGRDSAQMVGPATPGANDEERPSA